MRKAQDIYTAVVTSYPATHKHLMVTLSLLTALLWQTFSPLLPEFPPTAQAYEVTKTPVNDTEALIKKYADEEYALMYREAEMRATTRVFEEIGMYAETLNPNK